MLGTVAGVLCSEEQKQKEGGRNCKFAALSHYTLETARASAKITVEYACEVTWVL